MSSENLTTNQPELIPSVETPVSETKTTETVTNPLEETTTRLNFKVDQLGLNKPISQVPDDVKYFIDKQQGKFDSKYNFFEGFLKATTLDNFGVVAYNKGADVIKSGLNPFELDDNYRVTKEQFDIIEELVMDLAEQNNVDPEKIWEMLEDLTDEELLEYAVDAKGHKSSTGGLTQKGRDAYNAKGANLQAPVTTPPSKLKAGSKAANRRKSFCARMSGVEGPMKKPNGEPSRKALALRKWNC